MKSNLRALHENRKNWIKIGNVSRGFFRVDESSYNGQAWVAGAIYLNPKNGKAYGKEKIEGGYKWVCVNRRTSEYVIPGRSAGVKWVECSAIEHEVLDR